MPLSRISLGKNRRGVAGFFEDIPALIVVVLGVGIFLASMIKAFTYYQTSQYENEPEEEAQRLFEAFISYPALKREGYKDGTFDVGKLRNLTMEQLKRDIYTDYEYWIYIKDVSFYPNQKGFVFNTSLPLGAYLFSLGLEYQEYLTNGSINETLKKALIDYRIVITGVAIIYNDENVWKIREGSYSFSLPLVNANHLVKGPVNTEIKKGFDANDITLSSKAQMSNITDTWWIIEDGSKEYFINVSTSKLEVYAPYRKYRIEVSNIELNVFSSDDGTHSQFGYPVNIHTSIELHQKETCIHGAILFITIWK